MDETHPLRPGDADYEEALARQLADVDALPPGSPELIGYALHAAEEAFAQDPTDAHVAVIYRALARYAEGHGA